MTSLAYLYFCKALGFFGLGDKLLIYFTFLWLFPLKPESIFTVVTSIKLNQLPQDIKNRDKLHKSFYKEYNKLVTTAIISH